MSENCISVIVVTIRKIKKKMNWEAMTDVFFCIAPHHPAGFPGVAIPLAVGFRVI